MKEGNPYNFKPRIAKIRLYNISVKERKTLCDRSLKWFLFDQLIFLSKLTKTLDLSIILIYSRSSCLLDCENVNLK